MHRRLAERWAQHFALRILPAPWEAPNLTIGMQWNTYRQHDPALTWLRNLIIEVAAGMDRSDPQPDVPARAKEAGRVTDNIDQ